MLYCRKSFRQCFYLRINKSRLVFENCTFYSVQSCFVSSWYLCWILQKRTWFLFQERVDLCKKEERDDSIGRKGKATYRSRRTDSSPQLVTSYSIPCKSRQTRLCTPPAQSVEIHDYSPLVLIIPLHFSNSTKLTHQTCHLSAASELVNLYSHRQQLEENPK